MAKIAPNCGPLPRASRLGSCEVALGIALISSPHPARDAEVHSFSRKAGHRAPPARRSATTVRALNHRGFALLRSADAWTSCAAPIHGTARLAASDDPVRGGPARGRQMADIPPPEHQRRPFCGENAQISAVGPFPGSVPAIRVCTEARVRRLALQSNAKSDARCLAENAKGLATVFLSLPKRPISGAICTARLRL